MLKGIPTAISPELMSVLMKMGHGDELVLADANFPADSCGRRIVRADGHPLPVVLEAILKFFPMDTYVEHAAFVMAVTEKNAPEPPIWSEYRRIINAAEEREFPLQGIERFAFYERAKECYAVVATGETALYGNLILKKGVVKPR